MKKNNLVLGSAMWGWNVSEIECYKILDVYYEEGFRSFDCATNYPINKNPNSFRKSENILCNWIKDNKINDLKINIKIGSLDNKGSSINNLNKSSINSKPKFVLIDNIEFLNVNSINALLKILEEPNENTFFLLINNNKKILPTLKSRCLDFKIFLSHSKSIQVSNKIIGEDIYKLINKDLINYYSTPGNITNLINFSKDFDFDLIKYNLKDFLEYIVKDTRFKKHDSQIDPYVNL